MARALERGLGIRRSPGEGTLALPPQVITSLSEVSTGPGPMAQDPCNLLKEHPSGPMARPSKERIRR